MRTASNFANSLIFQMGKVRVQKRKGFLSAQSIARKRRRIPFLPSILLLFLPLSHSPPPSLILPLFFLLALPSFFVSLFKDVCVCVCTLLQWDG